MEWLRVLVYWLVILVLAFANGLFRQLILSPVLGEKWGEKVSPLLLSLFILAVSFHFVDTHSPSTLTLTLLVGGVWTVLGLAFEFLFFGVLMGESLDTLLEEYRVTEGRLLIVVWLTTLLGPAVMFLATSQGG